MRIAACKNPQNIAQLYLKLICIGEPQVWDTSDKGYAYRNAACISLGEFGRQAESAMPLLEELGKDNALPAAIVALVMIRLDLAAHATDEHLIAKFEQAKKSLPELTKIATAKDTGEQIRVAAIELLGRFGTEAKSALPALDTVVADPEYAKNQDSPVFKAAKKAIESIRMVLE